MTKTALQSADLVKKKSATVLVVDEDATTLQKVADCLSNQGYSIISATSTDEALRYLISSPISVVVTYHKLTGTSGLDFLAKVKEMKPEIQRILLDSGHLPLHMIESLNPLQILLDPCENDALVQAIANCIERFHFHVEKEQLLTLLTRHDQDLTDFRIKNASDRAIGNKIHSTLLIDQAPSNLPGLSIATIADTSVEIDGDFIIFHQPTENILDISLGDVMGKGLPSALIGAIVRSELVHISHPKKSQRYIFDHTSYWYEDIPTIKEVIEQLHLTIVDRLLSLDYYVSLFYGRLNLNARTFSFIDCGFTKPLFYRKMTKKAILLQSTNFPLGTVKYHEYIPFEIFYEEGDFMVLYSDAIIESKSPAGELFGENRLSKLVEENAELNPSALTLKIKQAVLHFTEDETIEDDFTLVIFKIDALCSILRDKSGIAKFNSILSQLDAVRKFVGELCAKVPGDSSRLSSELQLALDEIFTNIVIHGYGKKAGSPICIRADYLENKIMIEVADQGQPLNPYELPAVNLFGDREHGYGWYLIRQISDKIVYQPKNTQNGWNHLQIFKHYNYKREQVMELTTSEQDGVLILHLESESIDAKRVSEFKEKVLKIVKEKRVDQLVFDLHKVQFIDSSGLGAFLSLLRYMNTLGGQLSLAAMNIPVKTIFELVSMQKIFECYDTVEQAIKAHSNTKSYQ